MFTFAHVCHGQIAQKNPPVVPAREGRRKFNKTHFSTACIFCKLKP
jgi:hypothetical protein